MNSDDGDFRLMAITMQQKFDKYWGDIKKMNVLIYMGIILDPKVKFVGLKLAFAHMYPSPKDEELSQIVYRRATSLFDDYRKMYTPFTPHSDDSFSTSSRCTSSQPTIFDLKKDIENQVRSLDRRYSSSELDRYLNDQIGEHKLEMDILTWWKMNAHRYPILAHLARDVLAMPISTVASESTFSAGGRHLDSLRSSLTPKVRKDKERGVEEKLEEIEQLEKEEALRSRSPSGKDGSYSPHWKREHHQWHHEDNRDQDIKLEFPDFEGNLKPNEFLNWVRSMENMVEYKGYNDEKHCKLAILKLKRTCFFVV
uniref:Transposase n=1 Tax=Chenopodium quinoa TaxID=63459 RepID=A0A803NBK7_CHEQI